MNENFFRRIFNYSIFSLTILLIFLLVFEKFIRFPSLVEWIGHFHPVILHFPVVLVFVTIIQYWRKDQYLDWYVASTTLLTLLTAITGFILSLEGSEKGTIILVHQWMGVAVSLVMAFWFFISSLTKNQAKAVHGLLIIIILVTGHFGGMVTHGSDFLAISFNKSETETRHLPDDPNIYVDVVQPVLDSKCVSCHNQNKSKGGLVLSDFASLSKGGESGSLFDDELGLVYRLTLPKNHEDHMPPKDEDQLSTEELEIIKGWVEQGATEDIVFSEISESTSIYEIVAEMIKESRSGKWENLPEVSDELIRDLSSEYCTIKRLHHQSNALQVILFRHEDFGLKDIQKLDPIAENIVELKLSNLPLGKSEISHISKFRNMELLDLSNSTITNQEIGSLVKLEKLQKLKVYNTQIDDHAIESIIKFKALSGVNVYGTNISQKGISELYNARHDLIISEAASEAVDFKSVLPLPILNPVRHFFDQPFYLKLEHPLSGINIKYSLDQSDPQLSFTDDSLLVDKNYTIKYMASKEGWEESGIDSVRFIRSQIKPVNFELVNSPDQKYLGVGKSLLFDLEKGSGNFGDDAWMAFKDNAFVLNCELENEMIIKQIILSSIVNTDPYIFPPSSIEIFGGIQEGKLSRLHKSLPKGLRERKELYFKYYSCELEAIPVRHIKIVVNPLDKIPMWHRGKGERGWFFVDEVIISSR